MLDSIIVSMAKGVATAALFLGSLYVALYGCLMII